MGTKFLEDMLGAITGFFDRFILAFVRLFNGIIDERLRPEIHGFDIVIVLVSVGFVLYFLRAQFLGFFGFFSKSKTEHHRHERVLHYIETVGEEEEDEENPDITIGRR